MYVNRNVIESLLLMYLTCFKSFLFAAVAYKPIFFSSNSVKHKYFELGIGLNINPIETVVKSP